MAFATKIIRGSPRLFRQFSTTSSQNTKVAVLGAAGGIGQPLSLLLKTSSIGIKHLALYDVANVVGVTADLSHIDTACKVTAHAGASELDSALEGADIVVVPAGVPRKPGMTRDDLFNTNAGITATLATAALRVCPKAYLCLITNPVNSMVPLAVDLYMQNNAFNNQVIGVTMLDIVRANTFVAEAMGVSPLTIDVPVIGGHSGNTILPLLSQVNHNLSDEQVQALTQRIQNAGTEVVEAKAGTGSATLSMAHAAAQFVKMICHSVERSPALSKSFAYASTDRVNQFCMPFFTTRLSFGKTCLAVVDEDFELNAYETKLLEEEVKPQLLKDIEKGLAFAKDWQSK